MTSLKLGRQEINTVFDLLGKKENDITYSFGWGLAQSNSLAVGLLGEVASELRLTGVGKPTQIKLQNFVAPGFTDIEIESEGAHVIIEAKRGWELPEKAQLEKYAKSLGSQSSLDRGAEGRSGILVVGEGSREFARHKKCPEFVKGVKGHPIPVAYRSWADLVQLTEDTISASRSTNEKRLLRELVRYLKGLMSSRSVRDNMVYVCPLSFGPQEWSPMSPVDIVQKHGFYFHPVGGGYPHEPQNYLGFRFDGKLQQIHFAEHVEVTERPRDFLPEFTAKYDFDRPHYMYRLGPAIVPPHDVRTSGMYPGMKVYAALDLLLTSETVKEARDLTNARSEAAGE